MGRQSREKLEETIAPRIDLGFEPDDDSGAEVMDDADECDEYEHEWWE